MRVDLLKRARHLLTIQADLASWCRACGYEPAPHHRLITDRLQALATGQHPTGKVMVMMPPGSAKSTYGSVLFPPWYLAHNPHHSVLAASHSEELAERWGRRCRNLIEDRTAELGVMVNQDNRASWRWQLQPRPGVHGDDPLRMGEYLAAGAGSAIAGFRGDLGLIDDPVKSREQVASETQRNKLWDWYTFDYRPRLKPGAKQVLITTRWHEEDLAGRILAEEGEHWDVLSLPMEAEGNEDALGRPVGERLWPDWFTDEMVEVAKRDAVLWLSLYQQRPTAEEGTYWRRSWLHPVAPGQVPPRSIMRIYGGSDYAVTAAKGSDWTTHVVVGLDPEDRPWLLELWRGQTRSDIWINEWCGLVKHWRPMQWAEEQGQIISGVGPFLERESLAQHAFTERLQFVSRADKGIRAQSMRAHIAAHGLWYADDLPGRSAFEAELLSFPNGRNDDQHDALGLVGQLLDQAVRGKHPKVPDKPVKPGYRPVRTGSAIDTSLLV